jgi:hypothetical protein
MPRGIVKNHLPFQKGNKFGKGRPKLPSTETRQYTAQVLGEAINKLMGLTISELREVKDNPNTPSIEVIVARGMLRDKFTGELGNFDKILDRVIGKVPLRQEITGVQGLPAVQVHVHKSTPENVTAKKTSEPTSNNVCPKP